VPVARACRELWVYRQSTAGFIARCNEPPTTIYGARSAEHVQRPARCARGTKLCPTSRELGRRDPSPSSLQLSELEPNSITTQNSTPFNRIAWVKYSIFDHERSPTSLLGLQSNPQRFATSKVTARLTTRQRLPTCSSTLRAWLPIT